MLPGALSPSLNTCFDIGVDVDDQPALPGAVTEPEVDVQDGAGLE